MNILSIDTSGDGAGFAALSIDEDGTVQPLAVGVLPEAKGLSRQIIAAIDIVLERAGWTLDEVDLLAAGLGPGSWTGLRIGLTTAKTLAQSRAWALAGVPTFDAIAQAVWRQAWNDEVDEDAAPDDDAASDDAASGASMPEHFLLLVVAPCRAGEVYGKIFECHPERLVALQMEWIGTPEMMTGAVGAESLARDLHAPLALAGPAAPLLAAVLQEQGEPHFVAHVSAESIVIEVALAGAAVAEEGELADPLALQPLYLAPSAAERNLHRAL